MSTTPHTGNESRLVKCDGCGRYFPASEIRRCKSCGQLFCPDCRTTHDCRTSSSAPSSYPLDTAEQDSVQIRRTPETPRETSPQHVNYHGGLRFIDDDATSIGSAAAGPAVVAAHPYGQSSIDAGEPLIHDNMDSLERSISGEPRPAPAPIQREPYYSEPAQPQYQQPPQYQYQQPPQQYQQPPQYQYQQPSQQYQQPPQYQYQNPPQQYQQPPQYQYQQPPQQYQQPPLQQQPVVGQDERVCDECGQVYKKSDLRKCKKCGAILCPKCQKKHKCHKSSKQQKESPKQGEMIDQEAKKEKKLFGFKKDTSSNATKEPMSKSKKKLIIILIFLGILLIALVICGLIISNVLSEKIMLDLFSGLSS